MFFFFFVCFLLSRQDSLLPYMKQTASRTAFMFMGTDLIDLVPFYKLYLYMCLYQRILYKDYVDALKILIYAFPRNYLDFPNGLQ